MSEPGQSRKEFSTNLKSKLQSLWNNFKLIWNRWLGDYNIILFIILLIFNSLIFANSLFVSYNYLHYHYRANLVLENGETLYSYSEFAARVRELSTKSYEDGAYNIDGVRRLHGMPDDMVVDEFVKQNPWSEEFLYNPGIMEIMSDFNNYISHIDHWLSNPHNGLFTLLFSLIGYIVLFIIGYRYRLNNN